MYIRVRACTKKPCHSLMTSWVKPLRAIYLGYSYNLSVSIHTHRHIECLPITAAQSIQTDILKFAYYSSPIHTHRHIKCLPTISAQSIHIDILKFAYYSSPIHTNRHNEVCLLQQPNPYK